MQLSSTTKSHNTVSTSSRFLTLTYSDKTEAEKIRIVNSFPNLNPTCRIEDISLLFDTIDLIQINANLGNLTKNTADRIKENLRRNNALPATCDREELMHDLFLAAQHKPTFYSRIDSVKIQKLNYFGIINYTKTIQRVIDKLKQNYALYPNGDLLVGVFNSRSEFSGYGTKTFENDCQYIGSFKNELFHGEGTYKWIDGRLYEGSWKYGKKHGSGTFLWPNGNKYEGQWKNNERHGQGMFTWANDIQYKGGWENGKFHGFGTFIFQNGDAYNGHWQNIPQGGINIFHIQYDENSTLPKKIILSTKWDGLIIDDAK